MLVEFLHVVAGRTEVFARVELSGLLGKHRTDGGCHSQTAVGVDVDFAHCALCGLAGFLLVAGTNHTLSKDLAGGNGFTAIMVSWLAKFNPIVMVVTSFLIAFLQRGAGEIATNFNLNTSIADILTGIIIFFIIGSEFFLNYQIKTTKSKKEDK